MKFAMILAAAASLLAAHSALAQSACEKPSEPTVLDGNTATMEQLMAAKASVVAFMSASDTYQSCVIADLQAQQAAAKAAKKPLDPAVTKLADANVNENQAAKERAGKWFNAAVKAYKAAHPS